jgi:hypothetical protein
MTGAHIPPESFTLTQSTTHSGFTVTLHQGFANVVLLYSLFMGLWGLVLWARGRPPSGGYLGALILAEGVATLQALIGLALLVLGYRPHEALHYLYGVLAVVTLPSAYAYGNRASERRDSLIFGLAGLFLVGIAIRAFGTGGT